MNEHLASIKKAQSRWERTCRQACRECDGTGIVRNWFDYRNGTPAHCEEADCHECDGTGYRFSPEPDALQTLAGWRALYGSAATKSEHYNRARAAATKRRTLGWMAYSMCERAIRASAAFEELRRAWRAAA